MNKVESTAATPDLDKYPSGTGGSVITANMAEIIALKRREVTSLSIIQKSRHSMAEGINGVIVLL
jgi:hypothetical protein